ncbi:MAG: response regulator [Geobacter sp.]|nr:response regulator [Geobacter sp.]
MPNEFSRTILLVDDEPAILKATSLMLQGRGFNKVLTASDSRDVMPMLAAETVSVVVLDLNMPGTSGQELLPQIIATHPHISVIVMTALDETQSAVECMRAGAFDYLVKPVESARLEATISKALEVSALSCEMSSLKDYLLSDRLNYPEAFSSIITRDKRMRSIFQYVEVIAPSQLPVLITGETGVGKDMLAKSIHNVCQCKGQFVAVNVAGLDDNMFSDTLFGHKRGAFTGADQARDGLLSRAAGGTIFLDEIGDLSDLSQIKLLRLLQEQEYYPVGSDVTRKSTARVVLATNKPLKNLMASGEFRHDLYYRLCTHQIEIPPLRERPDDIPLLMEHFIEKACAALGRQKLTMSHALMSQLKTYQFPGNIRELEAIIFDAVVRQAAGGLSVDGGGHVIQGLGAGEISPKAAQPEADIEKIKSVFGCFPRISQMEDYLIVEAMKEVKGNQGAAAALLGITRQTLNKRIGEFRKEGNSQIS